MTDAVIVGARLIEDHPMEAAEFVRIRHKLGLSRSEMAAALRINLRTVEMNEAGHKDISGPVSLLMEHMDAGDIVARHPR